MAESGISIEAGKHFSEWIANPENVDTVGYVPRRMGSSTLMEKLANENPDTCELCVFENYETIRCKESDKIFSLLTPFENMSDKLTSAHRFNLHNKCFECNNTLITA